MSKSFLWNDLFLASKYASVAKKMGNLSKFFKVKRFAQVVKGLCKIVYKKPTRLQCGFGVMEKAPGGGGGSNRAKK